MYKMQCMKCMPLPWDMAWVPGRSWEGNRKLRDAPGMLGWFEGWHRASWRRSVEARCQILVQDAPARSNVPLIRTPEIYARSVPRRGYSAVQVTTFPFSHIHNAVFSFWYARYYFGLRNWMTRFRFLYYDIFCLLCTEIILDYVPFWGREDKNVFEHSVSGC